MHRIETFVSNYSHYMAHPRSRYSYNPNPNPNPPNAPEVKAAICETASHFNYEA